MTIRRWLTLCLAVTLLAAPMFSARAALDLKDYKYYKGMYLPAPGTDGFVGIAINDRIYDHAAPGLGDLRLVGPDGEAVPYVLAIQRGRLDEANYSPDLINMSVVPGSHQEFVVDLGERGKRNNQLELICRDQNFKRPVTISGSDDAVSWKVVRDDFWIFDFSGDVNVRDLILRYEVNVFRYLKVEIGLEGGEPLEIRGAQMRQRKIDNREVMEYKQLSLMVNDNNKRKATEIFVEFAQRNLPLNEFEFTVGAHEFYRTVVVHADPEFKRRLGEGVIYRYEVRGIINEKLTVSIGETLMDQVYFRILNQDNRSLQVRNVKAYGLRRVLIVRPPAQEGVRLYYGAENAKPPVYDLAELYPKVAEKTPELGYFIPEEQTNPLYQKPIPPPPPKDYAWLLWMALVPVALFLGYMVFRSLKEIDAGEAED